MANRRIFAALPAVLLLMLGCGTPQPGGNEARVGEEAFAQFADRLYDELDAQPISRGHRARIGLFGDLDVMSGEKVVMGRYRYRVDTVAGRPAGHLAFQIRDEEAGRTVPIILTFQPRDGEWHLENSRHVEEVTSHGASSPDAETSDGLTHLLNTRLESWAQAAVDRASE